MYLGNRSAKQTPEVKMAVENSSIDFKPEGSLSDQTKLDKQDQKSIVYKNIYPDIDFSYSLTEQGVKEEIFVKNQQAIINNPQFAFKLNLKNAVPQKDLMGNLTSTFIDRNNNHIAFILKLLLWLMLPVNALMKLA